MRGAVIEKLFTSGVGWSEGCSSCSSPTSPLDLKLVMSPRRVGDSSCDEVVSGRGIGLGIIVNMDKSCESTTILLRQSHHHKPNNNNAYPRKQLVYDNCGDEKLMSIFNISPTPERVVYDIKTGGAHFLSNCQKCNKQLHEKDIYMYRGEKAFCSIECRSMEIGKMKEEESMKRRMMRNKHECCSTRTSYAPQQVPISRSSGHGQMVSNGIFAI